LPVGRWEDLMILKFAASWKGRNEWKWLGYGGVLRRWDIGRAA
jgi:hypothetical protein